MSEYIYYDGKDISALVIGVDGSVTVNKRQTCTEVHESRAEMTVDYMCPFCVTPWKCNGPHIEPEDMANFNDYVNESSEQMRAACISAVEAQPFWIESTDQSDFEVLDKDGLLAALREVQP